MYAFTLILTGWGEDIDQAWEHALESERLGKLDAADLKHEIIDEDDGE
jgi:hypothetical protein